MQNLEQLRLLERVKLAYLRHRGNAIAVAQDTGLQVELVQKLIKKFRGKEAREVSVLIANTLMQQAMFGYQSRTQEANDMLRMLDGCERVLVSTCCHYPVRTHNDSNGDVHTCLKCKKVSEDLVMREQHSIIKLKLELLDFLREEDKNMVDFAERMGYTNKQPDVVVHDNRQYLAINGSPVPQIPSDDPMLKELQDMRPHEREDVRRELGRLIKAQKENNEQKETTPEQ